MLAIFREGDGRHCGVLELRILPRLLVCICDYVCGDKDDKGVSVKVTHSGNEVLGWVKY